MAEPTGDRDAVVIPTGYDPGSYSCVRSLSTRGVDTIIASEYDDVPAAASRFCDESVVIPSPHDDLVAYKDALVALAARPSVRTIFPLRPHDPYVFAKYREEFDRHVSLVAPSLDLLELVHDRVKLFDAAREAGVPIPETRRLAEAEGWATDLIVKARYNLLTDRYVPSLDSTDGATVKSFDFYPAEDALDLPSIREQMGHDPIVQEFVEASGEYVFAALYDHGEALATFQHRQIRGDSYTGGGGVYRRSVSDPALERVGRTLLDSLDWHGLACIEYIKDAETGEFKLVEVNPRLWQSLPCAVRAGADFPAHYWLQATGRADEIVPGYRTDVGTHLLYGELGYLKSILDDDSPFHDRPSLLIEAASVLGSCLTTPCFDNLRLDDPTPFLRGLRHVVSE